jgi:rhomboid protease GluP
MNADQLTAPEGPEGTRVAGMWKSPRRAHDRGLVVLSMGHPYWLIPHEGKYWLFVDSEDYDGIKDQLTRFEREQSRLRHWDDGHPDFRDQPGMRVPPLQWLLWAVWLVPIHLIHHLGHANLIGRGALDVAIVRQDGAWWRVVTALTLHADVAHLLGNLVFGTWFLWVVLRCYGAGWGWLLILLGGAGGNTLNVLLHVDQAHRAIGASTAVFAMLGLIAAWGFRTQNREGASWRPWYQRWAPVGMAAGLLGWWGTSGEQTDLMGHLFGFCAGLGPGMLAAGRFPCSHRWLNQVAGFLAFILPPVCWWLASR